MKSIAFTYPGFHALPRGIKQLLVTSESAFFEEVQVRKPSLREAVGTTVRPLIPTGHLFRHALRAGTSFA